MTALIFLALLADDSTDNDRTAILESGLTKTYSMILSQCRAPRPGRYIGGVNISVDVTKARGEVPNYARIGALKMQIFVTDGIGNLPTGQTTTDKQR